MWKRTKNFVLDILFPKTCLNCQRENYFLCPDCQALLEISGYHRRISTHYLQDLYIPLSLKNPLVKNMIQKFKCEPFVKELAESLADLIISYFQLMDTPQIQQKDNSVLIPVPLFKKRLKWRGFNQAEELAKKLSSSWEIPLLSDCLIKTKETPNQKELTNEARKENVKGAFICPNPDKISGKRILLIDDTYATGSTMEECAVLLKKAGAREIIGVAVAGD